MSGGSECLTGMQDYLATVVDRCRESLISNSDPFSGHSYLRGRGVTDDQIKTFGLGVGVSDVWVSRPLRDTQDGRLFNRQFRGDMTGQLVFPIYNCKGDLRGVETRVWGDTDKRKYTQYFLESWKEDAVFLGLPAALPRIWDTGVVYLTEGMFDFFVVQRVFPNTLCTLSARVMGTQIRFLQRWCRHVVFLFDMDAKGIEATEFIMSRHNVDTRDGFVAHTLKYPAKDPSELYSKWGFNRLERHFRSEADKLCLYL